MQYKDYYVKITPGQNLIRKLKTVRIFCAKGSGSRFSQTDRKKKSWTNFLRL